MKAEDYIQSITGAERRFYSESVRSAVRKINGADVPVIRGYAAKYNSLSEDMGGWRERISPGFFDKVLDQDVRVLRDHMSTYILGRTKTPEGFEPTAWIGSDNVGLWYEYIDPQTSYSLDLKKSIDRGDVSQSSFSFLLITAGDKWEKQDNVWVRTLLPSAAKNLFDVSPVTFPAYTNTEVASRSFSQVNNNPSTDQVEIDRDFRELDLNNLKNTK